MEDPDVATDAAAALERLYRADGARLWRAVWVYSGSRDIADDAVAEAFAQALRRGDAIGSPARWVWRVAFRIAAGELQDRAKASGSAPEVTVEMAEPAVDLVAALTRLGSKQRACLVLHHYAGYPVGEVSRIVGLSPPAVRMHLTRARRRMRTLLGKDAIDA